MHDKLYDELNRYLSDTLFYDDLPGLVISTGYIDEVSRECLPSNAYDNISGTFNPKCHALRQKLNGFQYKNACGFSDVTDKTPLTADHIFHMVSISKLFTGTAILLLVMRKMLSLDSKVCGILDSTCIDDKRYSDITIRQMLSHTSGLPDVHDYEWNNPRWDESALEEYAASDEIKKLHLLWGPEEERFSYSNIAFELLGLVIQKISGQSYEEFIKQNIFLTLGMNNSTMFTPERICAFHANFEDMSEKCVKDGVQFGKSDFLLRGLKMAGVAMPHTKDSERHIIKASCYPYNRCHAPSSTLTTNAEDMKKFAMGILNYKLLPASMFDDIWSEHAMIPNSREKMGLGWFMRRQHGFEFYGHEGTDEGFRGAFWVCPELRLYICIFSNITSAPMKKIAKKTFDIILDNIK